MTPLRTIQTPRLVLRPLGPLSKTSTDLHDLFSLRAHQSVMRWTRVGKADADTSSTAAWIDDFLGRGATAATYLVQLEPGPWNPTDRPVVIGMVGATHAPEIGYMFHPHYYGCGYATEALRGFIDVYWEVFPAAGGSGGDEDGRKAYDYAHAEVDSENEGSINVLKKCGFSFWGSKQGERSPGLEGERIAMYYRLARPGTMLNPVVMPEKSASGFA